jgi:hypothetical protein
MPRGRIGSGLSIGALEMMLTQKRNEIGKLKKQRTGIERELMQIDRRIEALGGGSGGRGRSGARSKNAKSLVATLEDVLSKGSKPMQVSDIVDRVKAAGYQSTSANFRGLVNQTLIKENKRFASAGRGLYQMK